VSKDNAFVSLWPLRHPFKSPNMVHYETNLYSKTATNYILFLNLKIGSSGICVSWSPTTQGGTLTLIFCRPDKIKKFGALTTEPTDILLSCFWSPFWNLPAPVCQPGGRVPPAPNMPLGSMKLEQ
jgi:hypothetical protein